MTERRAAPGRQGIQATRPSRVRPASVTTDGSPERIFLAVPDRPGTVDRSRNRDDGVVSPNRATCDPFRQPDSVAPVKAGRMAVIDRKRARDDPDGAPVCVHKAMVIRDTARVCRVRIAATDAIGRPGQARRHQGAIAFER